MCRLVSEFGRTCQRKLRVNAGRNKFMRCSRDGNGDRLHVVLNGAPLEEVDCFKYLGSQVAADGGYDRDILHRINRRAGGRGARVSACADLTNQLPSCWVDPRIA